MIRFFDLGLSKSIPKSPRGDHGGGGALGDRFPTVNAPTTRAAVVGSVDQTRGSKPALRFSLGIAPALMAGEAGRIMESMATRAVRTLVLYGGLLLGSGSAYAAPHVAATPLGDHRCQVKLASADQTQILVDYGLYQVQSRGGRLIYADEIRFYVSGAMVTPSSRVRIVVVSRDGNDPEEVRQADAAYVDGQYGLHADADFALLVQFQYAKMLTSRRRPRLEIAIVADGVWLRDPVSGSSNFGLDLTRAPECSDLFDG